MNTVQRYFVGLLFAAFCLADNVSAAAALNFDVIYVRYPATNPNNNFVSIPQGEHPYDIAAGADLVLLKPDGKQIVLVDCQQCSVMDPFISYDGKVVYYSLIEQPGTDSASYLYKIDLHDPGYRAIRLTYADQSDARLYSANQASKTRLKQYRGIRDMAPLPLSDGRILFTTNRSALTALNPGTDSVDKGSVQQFYVMDDHDGSKNTARLANMRRFDASSLHAVQHPFQLKDGRILFSTWQDVATKFRYAMTPLFTINPDGSNLQQFTEPHDHHKMLEHFVTQLANDDVISALYYPSFDYGFGIIMRYPLHIDGPDYLRGSIDQTWTWGKKYKVSYREFDRKGGLTITPHTTGNDVPAPNQSGKYSMPSAAPDDQLLVAYSSGTVNHFDAKCNSRDLCDHLLSGIYIIPRASSNIVTDPARLIKVIDSPKYNEIWPRAVVPYSAIYGIEKPLPMAKAVTDDRLPVASASAIVGTSSMYNRDGIEGLKYDPFQSNEQRELHDGNWTIQGAEAGVFTNKDIYAVRLIGTPPKPFTQPISKYRDKQAWNQISRYLADKRLDQVVARYGSYHGERWEILGEFPLSYKSAMDEQGNPDSSWAAKIPAETPFLIQALDKNGMTLTSELTWRALKAGEVRTDCGGCHAHAIEHLDLASTMAGKQQPITGVAGTTASTPGLSEGLWDLTSGEIPLLKGDGVEFIPGSVMGVEFNRDINPILQKNCASCHTVNGSGSMLVLDGSDGRDAWANLSDRRSPKGKKYIVPQRSKYIRVPQARQSLLVWIAYNQRLDGRSNDTRDNDIDFPENHPQLTLSEAEKRAIARWVDLGGPIDFPQTDGMGYTEDNQLPVLELTADGKNASWSAFIVGAYDVHSGLNWDSLKITLEAIDTQPSEGWASSLNQLLDGFGSSAQVLQPSRSEPASGRVFYQMPDNYLKPGQEYLLQAEIADKVGNKNIVSQRFTWH